MSHKDILVILEGRDAVQRLAFAAVQAARWNAHLTALFVASPMQATLDIGFAVGEAAIRSAFEHHRGLAQAAEEKARAAFDALVAEHGLRAAWIYSHDEPVERILSHARHCGLAVIGFPGRDGDSAASLCEDVVLASGRPTVLVPPGWPAEVSGKRILVGWNGSRESARALSDAMPLLEAADAVRLLLVAEERTAALVAGEEPGSDILRHLARCGVTASAEHVARGNPGEVLLERARNFGADLLVMGAYGHSRITELVFGGATRSVLLRAELPVFLSR